MKAFRQNTAKISADVYKKKCRLVILRNNKPLFEIHPISAEQEFVDDILCRAERAKRGRTYSTKEVRARLGLD
jgi:hypothetical protein